MGTSVANISVGVQNVGSPPGGSLGSLGHTYIAIQWQSGGTTILQSGPAGALQLEEANYPVSVGAQQTASADNNGMGAGTLNLAFGSQTANDQFAQKLLDAYGNYDANSATNPMYDALVAAGEPIQSASDIMQSLSSQSGLNISGALFNIDVFSSMLNNANNPQETLRPTPGIHKLTEAERLRRQRS